MDHIKHLPGRLGRPDSTLLDDPRLDPRIRAVYETVGLASYDAPGAEAGIDACRAFCAEFEAAGEITFEAQRAAMPKLDHVERRTETITGADGNEITLHVHKPSNVTESVPCILHTHGGGMVVMTAEDPMFVRWRDALAGEGLVVVGVEFRNGGGRLGNHPFPAGLNDCATAARWVHEHRDELGISGIVISGESGGGNLCIATTLKAKQEGWLDAISGVYAFCPYISGEYANPPAELLSLRENDGYMLDCKLMGSMVRVYDPEGQHGANALAWPLQADTDLLAGLPPHVISVNELDPLRDEGLAFFRKLLAAGVPVTARTVHGTPHAGDLGMPDVNPETFADSLRSLVAFARSVA